jgi:hypothetical protein
MIDPPSHEVSSPIMHGQDRSGLAIAGLLVVALTLGLGLVCIGGRSKSVVTM